MFVIDSEMIATFDACRRLIKDRFGDRYEEVMREVRISLRNDAEAYGLKVMEAASVFVYEHRHTMDHDDIQRAFIVAAAALDEWEAGADDDA